MCFGDSPVMNPLSPQLEVATWRGIGKETVSSPYPAIEAAYKTTSGPALQLPLRQYTALYVASSHTVSISWPNPYC